jgi:hypothetical protein
MATSPKNLKDVFERNQYDLMTSVRKSRAWFEQQVLIMSRQQLTPERVLQGNIEQLTNQVMPGFMYMFAYDPKGKAELPYYDRFPLVLPFRKTPDGFIGLNMHYLPYQLRILLLDRLLIFKNNSRFDETTRIKYSWALIDGISKYAAAKPCVKQYLNGHVRSRLRQINSNDWATAMLLPVERFVGASKQEIWAESRKVMIQ